MLVSVVVSPKLQPLQLSRGLLDQPRVLQAEHSASAAPEGRVVGIAVILDSRLINENSQRIGACALTESDGMYDRPPQLLLS
jgi:hypothetical protein